MPHNEFARLFLRLLEASSLPEPVSELPVRVAGHHYRIDCAYPGQLVAIELDGRDHEEPEAIDRDHARVNRLEAAGWIVLRFTWRRFAATPDDVVGEVRGALVARGLAA